jgi:hypothetical protein
MSEADDAREWLIGVWMDPDEVTQMGDAEAFHAVEQQREGGVVGLGQAKGWFD